MFVHLLTLVHRQLFQALPTFYSIMQTLRSFNLIPPWSVTSSNAQSSFPIVTLHPSTHFHCDWISTARQLSISMKPLLSDVAVVCRYPMVLILTTLNVTTNLNFFCKQDGGRNTQLISRSLCIVASKIFFLLIIASSFGKTLAAGGLLSRKKCTHMSMNITNGILKTAILSMLISPKHS